MCHYFRVSKKFGEAGAVKILRRTILSHSAEKIRRGIFTVALISGIENVWMKGGRNIKIFRRIFFCLTVPKISVGEFFFVALVSVAEKVWKRGGSVKIFRRKIFVSQFRKIP